MSDISTPPLTPPSTEDGVYASGLVLQHSPSLRSTFWSMEASPLKTPPSEPFPEGNALGLTCKDPLFVSIASAFSSSLAHLVPDALLQYSEPLSNNALGLYLPSSSPSPVFSGCISPLILESPAPLPLKCFPATPPSPAMISEDDELEQLCFARSRYPNGSETSVDFFRYDIAEKNHNQEYYTPGTRVDLTQQSLSPDFGVLLCWNKGDLILQPTDLPQLPQDVHVSPCCSICIDNDHFTFSLCDENDFILPQGYEHSDTTFSLVIERPPPRALPLHAPRPAKAAEILAVRQMAASF
ncbi:hypothetical protein GYMLUDRAFT_32428 [Collybiopsis luxurians FD-317 M1]|nr:hypothetical protein GYMLUDRAFT_32428 [Collybiopsis luxurians FD-317 M1]